jgi:hypothetical protein
MTTADEWRQRYINAMDLINKTPLDQSTKNRLQSAYDSICYAADEVVGYKMKSFVQICFEEEDEFKKHAICNQLKNILSGKTLCAP